MKVSPLILSESHIYDTLLKMLKKKDHFIVPVSTWLCFITRSRSDQKRSTTAIFGLEFPSSRFTVSIEVKSVFASSPVKNYFPLYKERNVASHSPLYFDFHDKSSDTLHSLVAQFQIFTAKTRHATYTGKTHRIPLVPFEYSFPRTATLRLRLI